MFDRFDKEFVLNIASFWIASTLDFWISEPGSDRRGGGRTERQLEYTSNGDYCVVLVYLLY
jgi:hypothetical protein